MIPIGGLKKSEKPVLKLDSKGRWRATGESVKTVAKVAADVRSESDTLRSQLTPATTAPPKSGPKAPVTTEITLKEAFLLEGELSLVITETTLTPKVGDTISLKGFGTFLSGDYYVTGRKREISSEGYSLSLTVMKQNYGRSLKR